MMNDFKQKAINHYIEMNQLFLYLLQQGEFDNDKISLMKQNHDSMRAALIDLGVKFTEIETIRELNLRIRDMESKSNSKDLNNQKVSLYINNINNQINHCLEEYGVSCIVNTSFSPNICISVSIVPSDSKEKPDYHNSEEQYLIANSKKHNQHVKFMENFIFLENKNDHMEMAFEQQNIDLLTKIIEDSLEQKSSQVSYELNSRHFKNDLSEKMLLPSLRKFNITFLTLPSHQSFAASMSRRYG